MRGPVLIAAALAAALSMAGAAPATPVTGLERLALANVQKARAAGRIDAATAASARSEIARAAHLVRALPNGRGYHVSVALSEVASFPAALTQPRTLALFGALRANDDYFAQHWAPADKTDIVGTDGVVYRYFGGHCFRFHPLANFGVLNARAVSGDEEQTRILADALVARGVYQAGGGIGWEYDFQFGGGRAPWLSGMAQAVAAQAFARAADVVPDESTAYLREAQAAYSLIPKRLLTTLAAGPWIRLYSFDRTAVFNAQLQATISLQTYAAATGDKGAGALATRMQNAAAATIPKFDTGYWSYYALPHVPSPVDYHKYVVQLLTKLSSADPRFANAAKRFAAYEKQPPAFQLANGGVGQVSFWLSKPATITATTPAGPSKRLSLLDGWHTIAWSPTKAGVYPVHVEAADWLGNKTAFDALPIVRVGAAATNTVRRPAAASVTGQAAFAVGAALDDPSQGATAQQLGLRLVRIGIAWPAGATVPDPGVLGALGRIPAGLQLVVELNAGAQPTGGIDQYAAALAQAVPGLRYLILAPAPTAAGAAAYSATLAGIRTAVRAVSQTVAVGPLIDGTLAPKATVMALGRAQPQADVVAFRPAASTTSGAWTQPDLKQVATAFRGSVPPLLLDGVATPASVPAEHAGDYPDGTPLTGVAPASQASAYAAAVSSVACSSSIAGVVFDRLVDSATAPSAPTGLYYPSGVAKPAAAAVSAAAAPAQRGTIVCPGLVNPAAASSVTYPESLTSGVPVSFQLGCARDCLYVATLVGADGRPVVAKRGTLTGGAAPTTVTLPKTSLGQASYTIDVRLASRVNPGPAVDLTSPPLPRG